MSEQNRLCIKREFCNDDCMTCTKAVKVELKSEIVNGKVITRPNGITRYKADKRGLQHGAYIVKGQWIPIESPTGVEAFGVKEMTVMNVRCSVCGSEEDVSFTGYKYCPRCGAKMEGR